MAEYTEGDIMEISVTFTDNDTGALVDPTTVTLTYKVVAPTGPAVGNGTLTYTGASSPATGTIARTGTGTYQANIDTTNLPGYWYREWAPTGLGQATLKDTARVYPAALL